LHNPVVLLGKSESSTGASWNVINIFAAVWCSIYRCRLNEPPWNADGRVCGLNE